MKKYLEVGKIVTMHGIKGEVRVQPWCDSAELLCEFDNLFFDKEGKKKVKVERSRPHKGMAILKLENVNDRDGAMLLRGKMLYADRDEFELPQGTYFIDDIIGLQVVDSTNGIVYGTITDVSPTGANDVYHVQTQNGEVLIPAIPQLIDKTDIEGGKLFITPMKGLFDED